MNTVREKKVSRVQIAQIAQISQISQISQIAQTVQTTQKVQKSLEPLISTEILSDKFTMSSSNAFALSNQFYLFFNKTRF
jgi:flagellar hook assembly protein FlgD